MRRSLSTLLLLVSSLLLAACAGLLGIKPRAVEHPFEHRAHSVKGIACLQCHEGMTRADKEGPLHLPAPEKCVGCHERPHDPRPCNGCHGTVHGRENARLARRHLRFTHDQHVKPLGGQCVPCHVVAGEREQSTMRPTMATCLSCHRHKDQWKTRECDGCHVDLPNELGRPSSHVVHEGDFVREHGVRAASARELCATCHSESQCASCHGVSTATLPWRLGFDRPQISGTGSLHRAGFRQRHMDEARSNPGLCTTCHGDGTYCSDCHQKERVGARDLGATRSPHPAGWVRARGGEHGREARLDPASCASCHGGRGEALCIGCHRVGGPGGNPHGRGFGSALDPKRDEPCRQCHLP